MYHEIQKLLCLISIVTGFWAQIDAQTTKEIVQITTPGSLQEVIDNLESSRFESLTIKGSLNATDIAYLNSGKGKMSLVETLDLSEVTLIPGEESYANYKSGSAPGGAYGFVFSIFYISDEYHIITERESSGLGGTNVYNHIYCNDLSGAFHGNDSFEKIILPQSLPNIGKDMFLESGRIKEVIMPLYADSIGNCSFYRCKSLEKVEFPTNLIYIGSDAFSETGIKDIKLPSTVKTIGKRAFEYSTLTSINLEDVKSIGERAFNGAKELNCAINVNNIDSIPPYAFAGTNIHSVSLSPTLRIISDYAFESTPIAKIALPETLEYIGADAFYYCRNLTEINVPASIKQIGARAFDGTPWSNNLKSEKGITYISNIAYQYDSNYKHNGDTFSFRDGTVATSNGFSFPNEIKEKIKNLELPESLIEIGDGTFNGFKILGEVKLPSSLRRIGIEAFAYCPKFWCTLPNSIYSIGRSAFASCSTLSRMTLPENLRYIGKEIFKDTSIGTLYINCKNLDYLPEDWEMSSTSAISDGFDLKKVIIGPKVTKLYDNMFNLSTTLASVEFDDITNSKLSYIGDRCFQTYYTVYIPHLPYSIQHIGEYAFRGCEFGSDVRFENVKYIGNNAFSNSKGIESVIIPEDIETLGGGIFEYSKDLRHVEFNASNFTPLNYSYGYAAGGSFSSNAGKIFANCDSLREVIIGSKVQKLPDYMFLSCSALENVTFNQYSSSRSHDIGKTSLSLGEGVFCWNENLKTIELPERTDSIGAEAFSSCRGLTALDIPATCVFLGKDVIDNSPVQSLYFNSPEPPYIDQRLADYFGGTIYVPEESYDSYKIQPALHNYKMEGIPTSSLEDIINDITPADILEVYNLNGQIITDRWNNGEKGIFIIKMSNGKVIKMNRQ